MYDFHYNYFKKKYNNKANLLFTDSLTHKIETKDVLRDFFGMIKINSKTAIIQKTQQISTKPIRK